ncbi:Rieske (2Fe-2S) domain protein [Gloeothece citriformis PCC 7424]|uniref:Rieske (2Fe-2S) domain protein n=1 Tax=Gloeothece citriformis (strain PCC 7424) TaxID=65393 RepID=B7K936_GLOC7|nr:Rieske 2Fe-2S domain-containing protein [Gloeothece citriformis]ACK72805.1 Rieske (2Fe-2S) domain protein [Gloeothece citriformis PCC 7424]
MAMLVGAPWLLGHRSMLGINQPKKVSLYGLDYVIWQEPNGKINALPNACPHMGAMLSEGWCETKNKDNSVVVCPFHALEFDSQGCTVLPGSNKKTLPQLKPLELMIEGDFIWSYGGYEPKISLPKILNEIAAKYEFIGYTGDTSVKTDLLSMLLNMHDYNHQNGTHRELFRIIEVQFKEFIDDGYSSHAFYDNITVPYQFWEKVQKPELFMIPKVIEAHLENHFPSLVIFYGNFPGGKLAQCHFFVPESETQTRTYVLMFAQTKNPVFKLLKNRILNLAKVVVEQDTDILGKIYANVPQKIKLNNEIGMDWVRRNFKTFSE